MRSMCPKKMRAFALGVMLILLAGCSAQSAGEVKILTEDVKTGSQSLKSVTVQRGSLQREQTLSANVAFAKKTTVRLQADDAQFVEHLVNVGQEVKQGDVLSVFRKRGDNIRLTEIRYELEELETARKDGLEDRAELFEEMQESIDAVKPNSHGYSNAQNELQLQILNMEMEKLQLEQEQFLLRLDEQERLLKEERKKLQQAEEELTVTAPVDGYVESVQYITPGQDCSRGQALVVLHDPAQIILVAENSLMGQLSMGQPVELRAGRYNSVMTVPGVVVSADNALPSELRNGKAYIALDIALDPSLANQVQLMSVVQNITTVKVNTTDMNLQDVLILPRDAVRYDNTKAYVEVINGTGTTLRYVNIGPTDRDNVMILGGLDEGDEVLNK